jgi:hypothetical protein
MKKHTANNQKKKHKIDAIEVSTDCLTSRAVLAPCVAYMNQIGIFTKLEPYFGAFSLIHVLLFGHLLARLFIWRLGNTRAAVVELVLDRMVIDNDDARCRDGVTPTYQKKKGFQPPRMNWGRVIIDAEFRPGTVHGNHGDTARRMITDMVRRIRRHYRKDVPIIIRMDSGFFDQEVFELCERLNIGYVCGGKMYYEVKAVACSATVGAWRPYKHHKSDELGWEYLEFGTACKTWKRF